VIGDTGKQLLFWDFCLEGNCLSWDWLLKRVSWAGRLDLTTWPPNSLSYELAGVTVDFFCPFATCDFLMILKIYGWHHSVWFLDHETISHTWWWHRCSGIDAAATWAFVVVTDKTWLILAEAYKLSIILLPQCPGFSISGTWSKSRTNSWAPSVPIILVFCRSSSAGDWRSTVHILSHPGLNFSSFTAVLQWSHNILL